MKLAIAIPSSSLTDEGTLLDKSRKLSQIGRTCAIFKVNTIYIYKVGRYVSDTSFMATILKYMETPQFLRKQLFSKINDLKYAGVLHPLKISSHITPSNPKKIQANDIREGVIISLKGKKFFYLGINHLIQYFGKEKVGKRVTIKFKEGYPKLIPQIISKDEVPVYWGYTVKERSDLFSLISSWKGNSILTSRKGKIITEPTIKQIKNSSKPLLVVFGSPEKGIHEVLGNNIKKIQNSKTLNFFPNQATETVRLEEAIMGTLAILNTV